MEGASTVINTIGFIATTTIVAGIIGVFFLYLAPILAHLPVFIIELLSYIISLALLYHKRFIKVKLLPNSSLFITVLGCLFLSAIFAFSIFYRNSNTNLNFKLVSLFTAILYSYQAIRIESQLIGLLAVVGLFAFLGFTAGIMPFVYMIGFQDDAAIVSCMNVAFYLLLGYMYARTTRYSSYAEIFKYGVLIFGVLVYFIGCLIIQSKWYSDTTQTYIFSNIIAIGSSLAALTLGSTVKDMQYLKSIGGTFLILIIIEKYMIEIPWNQNTWVWGVLGFGVILYSLVLYIHQHPELITKFKI